MVLMDEAVIPRTINNLATKPICEITCNQEYGEDFVTFQMN